MDLMTLLPLLAAVFLFWKLRSVLGTRNGAERPPYDPYVGDETKSADPAATDNDNVVTLPNARRSRGEPEEVDPAVAAIERVAGDDRDLKRGLTAIHAKDPTFDPEQFLEGARMAYEMIVQAFADGDRRALKGLLSREVFDNFEAAIDAREERGETVRSSFVGIEKADITGAELDGDEAQITVHFVSEIVSATLDADENVIEGDLQEVAETTDTWTFARPARSRDPNWKLVATDG